MYLISKYEMTNSILTKILWIRDEADLHTNGVTHVFYIHYKMGEILKC